MQYKVEWDRVVKQQFTHALAEAYLAGDDQTIKFLDSIADWIDANLKHAPHSKGVHTQNVPARTIAVPVTSAKWQLVAATFTINDQQRKVRIVRLTFL
jgi:hypothetical protein